MKNALSFILLVFISLNCHAQISFEKGYFIDNANQKIECLIKNIDWKNNPVEFEYKIAEGQSEEIKTIKAAKEFGVYDKSKYVRRLVDIDRSSNSLSQLTKDRNPVFKKEELFLEVLIDGKASLFLYEDGSLRRFFYTVDDSDTVQLVYKSYKASDNKVGENNRFKQQLWDDLKCQNILMPDIQMLNYSKRELIKLFEKFNKCTSSDYISYGNKKTKKLFNLSVRPGIRASALTVDSSTLDRRDAQFDTKVGFRLGLEAEFVMAFNRNKWAIIIEPTYQYYKAEAQLERYFVQTDYKSIELPIGIRHYMFLNNQSKVFLNGSFVLDFPMNSVVDYDTVTDLDIDSKPNLAFGIGYNFNDKISLEARLQTGRDVLRGWQSSSSTYKSFSLIVGYTIL